MNLTFYKFQGAGNDFIIVNSLDEKVSLSSQQIVDLCSRKFGVGSDGLMIVSPSSKPALDFHLEFYNPDGSKSFCGNGSRCAVKWYCGSFNKSECNFSAFDGDHYASLQGELVKLEMLVPNQGVLSNHEFVINTGAPHVCIATEDLDGLDLENEAKPVRWRESFAPIGVNVNYFESVSDKMVKMRTFEKGVEAETLACGTGVTAVACNFFYLHPEAIEVAIQTKGGNLSVSKKEEGKFWLTGPAVHVFTGEINI